MIIFLLQQPCNVHANDNEKEIHTEIKNENQNENGVAFGLRAQQESARS